MKQFESPGRISFCVMQVKFELIETRSIYNYLCHVRISNFNLIHLLSCLIKLKNYDHRLRDNFIIWLVTQRKGGRITAALISSFGCLF